tara:strand:+ start:2009 stop:2257 length:249 start_codon:yes stop_codon:yes gene_type:complete
MTKITIPIKRTIKVIIEEEVNDGVYSDRPYYKCTSPDDIAHTSIFLSACAEAIEEINALDEVIGFEYQDTDVVIYTTKPPIS